MHKQTKDAGAPALSHVGKIMIVVVNKDGTGHVSDYDITQDNPVPPLKLFGNPPKTTKPFEVLPRRFEEVFDIAAKKQKSQKDDSSGSPEKDPK
jgi:hypothetical protein